MSEKSFDLRSSRESVRLTRRRLVAGLGLLASTGILAACSGSQSAAPTAAAAAPVNTPAAAPTAPPAATAATNASQPATSPAAQAASTTPANITFWHVDSGSLNKPVQDAIVDFQQQHPGITVKLENPAPWNTVPTKYAAAFKAGSAADVCQVAFPWTFGFAQQGAITDVSRYVQKAGIQSDFIKPAWNMVLYQSKPFGVPWQADTLGLVYRADWFKTNNLTPPATMDDLLTVAKKLTDQSKNQYGIGYAGGFVFFDLTTHLWGNGGDFVTQNSDGTWKSVINSKAGAATIQYWIDLVQKDKVTPQSIVTLANYLDADPGLAIGQFGMVFMAPGEYRDLRNTHPNVEIGTAIYPAGTANKPSKMGGRSLVIPKSTKAPDAAWAFTEYLTSAEAFSKHLRAIAEFPTRQSVLDKVQWDPLDKPYVDMIPYSRTYPSFAQFAAIQQGMNKDFQAGLAGNQTGEAVAKQMDSHITALIKQ